jgi:hypothetical protein
MEKESPPNQGGLSGRSVTERLSMGESFSTASQPLKTLVIGS